MKFIPLHTKNTAIVYKNALCSSATVLVVIFVVLSVMIPVLLVSVLSPYSGITESRVLFEQPSLEFKFQYIFVAEVEPQENAVPTTKNLLVCSSFPIFNERMRDYVKSCEGIKYWTEDLDHDKTTDRAHFQVQLVTPPGRIKRFDLVLFFAAHLKHKCSLAPPALLATSLNIPSSAQLGAGTILLKAELQLKQYIEFTCPFPGRNAKTHFREVVINQNMSASVEQFRLESLLRQVKANPAFFQLDVQEQYFRHDTPEGLRIELDVAIPQLAARYHLSVWERLGQFWLYFASFFGISFYVMNKLKDFLFGNHIIRAWEVIPWKKLY